MIHSHVRPRRQRDFTEFNLRNLSGNDGDRHQRHRPAPIEIDLHHTRIVDDRSAADALARMAGTARRTIPRAIVFAGSICRVLLAAPAAFVRFAAVMPRRMPRPAYERTCQESGDHQAGNGTAHDPNYSELKLSNQSRVFCRFSRRVKDPPWRTVVVILLL